jgi:sugar (pentulose or hexulose) kinase
LRAMRSAGVEADSFVAAGGFTNSRQLMQMHADVSGVPITFTEVGDAVVLGGAILAAVGAEVFPSLEEAVDSMVHETEVIEPDPDLQERYEFFVDAYMEAYPAMRPLIHRVTEKVAEDDMESAAQT